MDHTETTNSMDIVEEELSIPEAEDLGQGDTEEVAEGWDEAALVEEAKALQAIYPTFDLHQSMQDDGFAALVRGEVRPTLRQVYEMLCPQVLVEREVQAGVEAGVARAVEEAVAEAVEKAEQNLLSHIRARGMRPPENGKNAALGVRMHPAVHRLTRDDRAKLAMRAQRGETIRL